MGKFRSEKNDNYNDCATKSGQSKEDEPSHPPGATNSHIKGARGAYLKIIVSYKCHWALLDTGGEVSIAPKSVVHDESIFPSTQSLRAANGSSINVVGEAVLPIQIRDKLFPLHCLVAENVSEIILGLDWLNANAGVWNFRNKTLSLNGETFSIKEIEEPNGRIMKLSTETVIPGRSEMNLNTETVYSDLWKHDGSWVTKPCLIGNTVLIARTMVADRTDNVVLRVVNVGSESVILQKGSKICQLEEYEDPSPIIEKEKNDDEEKDESAWIRTILDKIPDSVPNYHMDRLKLLLIKYEAVFSKGALDLGRSNWIEHQIDTGDSKPVRQALRTQPITLLETIDKLKHYLGEMPPSWIELGEDSTTISEEMRTTDFLLDEPDTGMRPIPDFSSESKLHEPGSLEKVVEKEAKGLKKWNAPCPSLS